MDMSKTLSKVLAIILCEFHLRSSIIIFTKCIFVLLFSCLMTVFPRATGRLLPGASDEQLQAHRLECSCCHQASFW
jgi:hypothetical protein